MLHNRKWGLGVPWSYYFRQIRDLKEIVNELPNFSIIKNGPFNLQRVKSLVSKFDKGDDTDEPLIRQLVMLAVWDQA